MNTTEIQKNFFQEESQKLKKEKRTTLLNQKKARDKTKPKKTKLKPNKRIKKKFIKNKIKKITNTLSDDISLETNTTLITLEEEQIQNNSEMLKYLEEIEYVIKDIYAKGIYFKNLKNFIKIENEKGQIPEKTENVKFLTENLKNCINSLKYSDKIDLILDIDETLVFSTMIKELQKDDDVNKEIETLQKNGESDIYYIKLESANKIYIFKVYIRKNMAEFFRKLSPYCNFYINTMASPLYVKEVIDILCNNYGLKLSNIYQNNVIFTSPNNKKYLPDEITKKENFLILDDNICAWDIKYIPSIIPVRKFHINDSPPKNIYYQYYLFSNKIYCFDEIIRPFLNPLNKVPYCVENSTKENSQLYYMTEMIIKSFILSNILEIPIRHSLHFFQNTILKGNYIYYDSYDKDFINEMIFLLGGSVVKNKESATHIIMNKNFLTDSNSKNNQEKYVLDVKWVFDCFFNFKKCDVYDLEYKIK